MLANMRTGLLETNSSAIDDGCAHRVASAWVASVIKDGIHLFSVYLIDCVGIDEANMKILSFNTFALFSYDFM